MQSLVGLEGKTGHSLVRLEGKEGGGPSLVGLEGKKGYSLEGKKGLALCQLRLQYAQHILGGLHAGARQSCFKSWRQKGILCGKGIPCGTRREEGVFPCEIRREGRPSLLGLEGKRG